MPGASHYRSVPGEFYERPANLFAAGFVAPAIMNFFPARFDPRSD